ncbi:MAG: hypothetical protein IT370_03935 [Deltaproteobacteria bacterium]|nr:hypothetical protein [Deltaproteobacteria bacterium]
MRGLAVIGVVVAVFGAAAADPGPSTSTSTGPSTSTSTSTSPSTRARFGVPPLPAAGPRYGEAELLADALRVADLVVVGSVAGDQLTITSILAGTPAAALQPREGVVRIAGPRFQPGGGVWLLLATSVGYYALNPHALGLPVVDGPTLVAAMPAPRPITQVQYGTRDLTVSVVEDGLATLVLGFDAGGALQRVRHAPATGVGFDLELDAGQVHSFSHLRAGLRHGRHQTWAAGKLALDARYQDNLRLPIVRAPRDRAVTRRSGEVAILTRTEAGNRYEVPAGLLARLRIGMTAAAVARLLGVDFSLPDGIQVVNATCASDLHVRFARGRVVSLDWSPSGRLACSSSE